MKVYRWMYVVLNAYSTLIFVINGNFKIWVDSRKSISKNCKDWLLVKLAIMLETKNSICETINNKK
jgi:hypothetical protein